MSVTTGTDPVPAVLHDPHVLDDRLAAGEIDAVVLEVLDRSVADGRAVRCPFDSIVRCVRAVDSKAVQVDCHVGGGNLNAGAAGGHGKITAKLVASWL